jgi:hypothetical protein
VNVFHLVLLAITLLIQVLQLVESKIKLLVWHILHLGNLLLYTNTGFENLFVELLQLWTKRFKPLKICFIAREVCHLLILETEFE